MMNKKAPFGAFLNGKLKIENGKLMSRRKN
jgi:hypothetical protein